MGPVLIGVDLDEAHGHIGAMVRYPLVAGEDVLQNEPRLQGAGTPAQTLDVALAHLNAQLVDDLFQRLHSSGPARIVRGEDADGQVQNVTDGLAVDPQLPAALLGEGQALVVELLGGFRQIDGVVRDPLKVVDAVHEDGQCPAVRLVQVPAG